MASSCPSQDQQNFECVTIASVDFIKLPLKDILESRIQPVDLFKEINSCPALLSHKHKLGQDQLNLCFLQPPAEPDYRKFDVTLLYTLIRNLCPSLKPTKGWGTQPDDADIQIGDDIERLRLFRNNYYGHASSAAISDFDFAKIWKDLKSVINRVQSTTKCSVDYEDELIKIERAKFTRDQLENCKLLLEAIVILGQQRKNGEEPHIVIKGEDEVVCGCTANFKAEVKKIDLSRWLIKWQKLNGLITEIINTSKEKYTGSTDTQLVIQSVCREDEGKYQAVILQESKGIENRLSSNIICLHVVEDSNWKAMTKTKITTGKEMETETLKTMIKFLLTTMKNPSKMWLASDLIQVLDDTLKTIDECGRSDLLKELMTEIREDDEIQLTLSSCGIKMFYALKSITKKYRSTDLKITDGCVCLTFSFATYDSLEKYLNLLRIGDEDLRRDLTDVMLNKTLLEIFHIDSYHVTWSIDKDPRSLKKNTLQNQLLKCVKQLMKFILEYRDQISRPCEGI